jgi:hypothetical protein
MGTVTDPALLSADDLTLRRREAELRELLRTGGIIDGFGPGAIGEALEALRVFRERSDLWPKEIG